MGIQFKGKNIRFLILLSQFESEYALIIIDLYKSNRLCSVVVCILHCQCEGQGSIPSQSATRLKSPIPTVVGQANGGLSLIGKAVVLKTTSNHVKVVCQFKSDILLYRHLESKSIRLQDLPAKQSVQVIVYVSSTLLSAYREISQWLRSLLWEQEIRSSSPLFPTNGVCSVIG